MTSIIELGTSLAFAIFIIITSQIINCHSKSKEFEKKAIISGWS